MQHLPRRLLKTTTAAAALALLLAAGTARWNSGLLYSLVAWCLTKPGGVVPVTLLKLAALLLDDEELRPGRGLDVPGSLAGKVALITGSTQGIGFEAAKLFHGRGAHVVVSGRSQANSEARASMLRAMGGPGEATGMGVNLEDFEDVRRFAAAVSSRFEAVDYLLLNAAASATREPGMIVAKSGHDRSYVANYLSNFLLVRLLAPQIPPGGSVVLVSSVVMWAAMFDFLMPPGGRVPWEYRTDVDVYQQYQVAKLALCVCFRDSLGKTLGRRGVRIRSMVPGYIITNMTAGAWMHPSYKPWAYHRLARTEVGGRLLFESAFATPLAPDHDFLYAFWFPSHIFRPLRSQALWEFRVSISGFFPQAQAYQWLYGMRLHSSVSPECDEPTQNSLWSWSSNATGLADEM
mmetsp:Transcript_116376/g.362487  ORF Transcript_116376/g.362487 Transcript_116376/m.362487 type:complete len:405 (-) Transcript_116376:156-1370(-)